MTSSLDYVRLYRIFQSNENEIYFKIQDLSSLEEKISSSKHMFNSTQCPHTKNTIPLQPGGGGAG